ncbi:MAG: MATE family efflux transporter [Planctomycetes bacterium]|nr:MATE family efflux transporter [Planctomycetota bacterium]
MTSPAPRPVLAELRELARLALPVIAAQIALMAMGVIELAYVGHLGRDALAGVAAGITWAFAVFIVPMGVLFAADPVASQAWGAGDRKACGEALARSLALAVVVSMPTMVAWAFTAPVLYVLGQPSEAIPFARSFILWSIPGVLPVLCFHALRQVLQGMGTIRPVLLASLAGTLCEAFSGWVLVFGKLGFPAMGVAGAGLASSLSRFVLFGVLLVLAGREERFRQVRPWARLDALSPRAILRLGLLGAPIGIQYGLEVWVFSIVGVWMGWLGSSELAGHQIALNLASLSFMVPVGISVAASVRVGQAVGRRDPAGMRRAGWTAMAAVSAVMVLFAVAFAIFPGPLARLYTDDGEAAAMAALLIPMAALFQICDGAQSVGFGVLRGTGDVRLPPFINLVGYYAVALPLGWWLAFRRDGGPRGLWTALVVGLFLVAGLLVLRIAFRFRREIAPLAAKDGDPCLRPADLP